MRKHATLAEATLWDLLRNRTADGLKFRRQAPCGPYILDFYCAESHLVVEVDGENHLDPAQQRYDDERTRHLASLDLRVLRFSNADVLLRPETVAAEIQRSTVAAPHPLPLSHGERGESTS